MADISDSDRELIEELRHMSKHLLTPDFDTDYNILRFIQGCNYDKDAALDNLQRHLKLRKVFQFDKLDELDDNEIVKEHYPIGILGTSGKDNKIVMVDCAGLADVAGISKSVEATEFMRYRFQYMEQVLKALNEQEKLTEKQSSALYICDLDGVSMDPFLITTLTGSYRMLWNTVFENYPEFIHEVLVINCPAFVTVLWNTFIPLLPERTRKKVKLLQENWKEQLLEYIDADHLPVHWGGTMVDENGDPMCRSKVVVPQGKVPERLYWQNMEKYKELSDDQIKQKTIKAGSYAIWSFWIEEAGTVLQYYFTSANDFSFAIYYTEDRNETDTKNMEVLFPYIVGPGGLAPDRFHFVCEHPGAYHIRLGNEMAWFYSMYLKYQWRFISPGGSQANVEPLNDDAKQSQE